MTQPTVARFGLVLFRLLNIEEKMNLCLLGTVDLSRTSFCLRDRSVEVVRSSTMGELCVLGKRIVLSMRLIPLVFSLGSSSVAIGCTEGN